VTFLTPSTIRRYASRRTRPEDFALREAEARSPSPRGSNGS
jgi:hypothetical protein